MGSSLTDLSILAELAPNPRKIAKRTELVVPMRDEYLDRLSQLPALESLIPPFATCSRGNYIYIYIFRNIDLLKADPLLALISFFLKVLNYGRNAI